MARIGIFADAHGDLRPLKKIAPMVEYLLGCGDLSFYDEGIFPKPLYTITGNHEMWVFIKMLKNGKVKIKNLHLIESGAVYNIAGLRVAGLNGNYSPAYKTHPRHFTKEDVERCCRLKGVDIFLSHEAPLGIGLMSKRDGKDMGVKPVYEIIERAKPKFLFCGHHHYHAEAKLDATKVICLPRLNEGYALFDSKRMEYEFVKTVRRTADIAEK